MSGQFQSRLISIMQSELDAQGMNMGVGCQAQIERMIGRGIVRMRSNKILDSPGHIMQAELNLRGLVRYFCDYSRELGTHPTLADSDFDRALVACPTFFPFWSS